MNVIDFLLHFNTFPPQTFIA